MANKGKAEEKQSIQDFLKLEFERMGPDHDKRVGADIRWFKQFRGKSEASKKSTKSNLFIQRTKVACIAGVANVMDIVFPSDDFFDTLGRNEQDQQGAEATKKVMAWDLRNARFFRESLSYILQAAVTGTTFGKIVPYTLTETVIDKLPMMMSPEIPVPTGIRTESRKKTVKLAKMEPVDNVDMWIDPTWKNVDDASGMFHRVRRTLNYCKAKEREGIYHRISEVEALINNRKGKADEDYNRRRQSIGLPSLNFGANTVSLYEYSGKVPAEAAKAAGVKVNDNEFEVEVIATLAEMEVLLRVERNTMPGQTRMFISDVWEPSGDGSGFGRGIPENVRGSQQALNLTVNLRLDNKAWAIAAPLVVNIDKMEDPERDLVARVNWVIRGRGASPSEIAQFAQIPDMTGNSIGEAQEFERHIDEESGMNKQVQATQSFGSNRTLGGISLAYSAASRPVRLIAKGFEDNLVGQGLKKIFLLLAAGLDDEMIVRVTDDPQAPQFLHIDPLSLALDVDFIASGSFALTQRDQTIQSMNGFFDSMSKIPTVVQMPNWNWKNIVMDYHNALGLKNFKRWWNDNPQVPAGAAPGAPGAGATGGGGLPPQLAALLAGGADEAGADGSGGTPGAVEGTGVLDVLAKLGRLVGGGAGEGQPGMA